MSTQFGAPRRLVSPRSRTAVGQSRTTEGGAGLRLAVSSTPTERPPVSHSTTANALCPTDSSLDAAMQVVTNTTGRMRRVGRDPSPTLSPEAKMRLGWLDWHFANGKNVSLTCRHFAVPRVTFYRWLKRYDPKDLTSLEDRSCRPRRTRRRTWTSKEIEAVRTLREEFPRWGKMKLARLLKDKDLILSPSRVGRILAYLKRHGRLKEAVRRLTNRRRQWKRQYASRKPKDYAVTRPGDLVQIDTMDVRPEPGVVLKQFSTVDVVSRWSVPTVASNATAQLARRALGVLIERSPFPIRAIQIDGGSEFMAEFEDECRDRGIKLFLLPPRSPKLNGAVERINRTHREEFYDCSTATPTVAGFAPALRRWERIYNHVRPHQALGYLTPAQFLRNWAAANTPQREELSQRS